VFLTSLVSATSVTYSSFEQTKENQVYALAINVPSETDNDLYFTFRGPSTASWIAFGLGGKGQQMDGALIFVAYLNEDGNNITVSPRLGTGHVQPQYTSDVEVTVMGDTHYDGDHDGGYFIEFHCTNCRSWSGGSIDITDEKASMIWAIGSGDHVKSDAQDATISQHDFPNSGGFTLDLKQATGPGGLPSESDLGGSNGGSGGGPSGRTIGSAFHALFMVGGFLVVLPAGYLALRVFERVWMHWAIQSFGLFLIVCGSVGGIVLSKRNNIVSFSVDIFYEAPY
jgi:Cytochrome domain of cellobiose dehydrogenase